MTNPTQFDRRGFIAGAGLLAAGSAFSREASAADESPDFAKLQKALADKQPLTWVLTGDSITHGALHTKGWRSYPEHVAERVRWEMRRVRDVVINTGISGDRAGGILKDVDWRVLRFQPNIVSIMIGMNDCSDGEKGRDRFRSDLSAVLDKVVAAGAIPVVHTPNTIHVKNTGGRTDLPAYAEIARRIASDRRFLLVDHWEHWSKAKPNQEDLLAWLEDKTIHPNVYGHREFAKLMFRVLGIHDDASPTCRLEVP